MEETERGPLEWLAVRVGSGYVSDLRHDICAPEVRLAMRGALDGPIPTLWDAAQWSDAASYLTGRRVAFPTVEEVLDDLRRSLAL